MTSHKRKYRALCEDRGDTLPIFHLDWWLDATAGEDHWDVARVEKAGTTAATMAYSIKRAYGFRLISQPALTQTLGPWMHAQFGRTPTEQKELMQALASQLPVYDHFVQNWHHSQQNWLPFYWLGFRQTTRYTYILPELTSTDRLWKNLRPNIRSDIIKASERHNLRIRTDVPLPDFLALNELVFRRQGLKTPYSRGIVENLDSAAAARHCRRVFAAEDEKGRLHAAVYVVWNALSAYYLMGGSDPELRNSGATSLCLWEAIKFASSVSYRFDFEGSMLEPVERFVRAFGAVQTPYFCVRRTPSRALRTGLFFRGGL